MKTILVICATAVMLMSGTVSAGHCDPELTEAEWAMDTTSIFEPNILEAADALIAQALTVCIQEEEGLLTDGFDSPLSDPEYVSMGQSMLINAKQLVSPQ